MFYQLFKQALLVLFIILIGCDEKKRSNIPLDTVSNVMVDSASHWLQVCEDQSICGENLVCVCGICTTTCSNVDTCGGEEISRCLSTSEDIRCEGADSPVQTGSICWPTKDHPSSTFELCNDKIDNNNDGLVDCEDPECAQNDFCIEGDDPLECVDGVDNDLNGRVDCEAFACSRQMICNSRPRKISTTI